DLGVTKRVLSRNESEGKIIVSESGLRTADDIRFLSKFGAQAFLIGTAVVSAPNVEEKVKEFVSAL
ncbi:indole-3-glycerol-phosphate synthase, partial [Candidatus Bathyarchaeota archaeon]|nr:indole-3-glycerol-phosphate synthase [Candidatus Bathyarchaeota archaeon]